MINEYLTKLEEELKYLKPKDASEVIKFYQDKINVSLDYGDSEAKIIASLPKPEKIAEEIYASKGIAYVNIRKKQIKRQETSKGLFSLLIVLLIALAFVVINIFLITSVVQLSKLLMSSFSMNALLDIFSVFIICLAYILILLIADVYIFDLLYILSMHFLYDVLYVFDKKHKDYKFMDFTITGYLEKVTKMPKIVFKALMGCLIALVSFGLLNYTLKGYMYRSMNNMTTIAEEYLVEESISKIVLEDSEVLVWVKESTQVSNVTFNFGSEFNNKFSYEVKDGVCNISSMKTTKYDLLGLLNEPISVLEIVIPLGKKIDIIELNVSLGSVDIANLNSIESLNLNLSDTDMAITNNHIKNLNITSNETNIGFSENTIENAVYNIKAGTISINDDIYNSLEINDKLAKLTIENLNSKNAKITVDASNSTLNKINCENLEYNDVSSSSIITDVIGNNVKISSIKNASTSITRVVTKDVLDFTTSNNSTGTLRYAKAPQINANLSGGRYNLYDININDLNTSESDNLYLNAYNSYSVNTSLKLISHSTTIVMQDFEINVADFELNDGRFNIETGEIVRSNITLNDADLAINNLDGQLMYAYVNGGYFAFYNETLGKSNIALTIEGELIKTTIEVDSESLREYSRG